MDPDFIILKVDPMNQMWLKFIMVSILNMTSLISANAKYSFSCGYDVIYLLLGTPGKNVHNTQS